MRVGTRLAILLITMLGCVGCDQVTKSVVRAELQPGRTISLLGGVLLLRRAENPGAFLSAGESLSAGMRRALFTVGGTALVLGAIGWALFSKRLRLSGVIGAALICGGGIGNLIDRFGHNGYVTDFLNVGVGALRTGIFNVADFLLLLGLALAVHDGMAARH
jgi:signal peptidase II